MRFLCFTFFCAALTTSLSAHAQHSPKQIVVDALRHRSLSEAQAIAAKCSPEKKGLEACVAEAKPLCRGLAIGKHCGLRETATSDFSAALQAASKAHAVAALCLENAKPYEECVWDLQTACKGLAIGKYCGLSHTHSF